MFGKVLVSWTACLRSFSAFIRISAALLRSASESMGVLPAFVFRGPLILERPANDNELQACGMRLVARIERSEIRVGKASLVTRISLTLNPGYLVTLAAAPVPSRPARGRYR